ncbi:MAG: TIGR00730 family Rossman fold protein [Bacteroidota bacterium]
MKSRICVFCGSSLGSNPSYVSAAEALGEAIAHNGYTLVYGGGNIGLMGVIADKVLDCSGHVTGIMPEHLAAHEIAHRKIQDLQLVEDMMERKKALIAQSDMFIAMPGGFGTLDELSEVITWNQLKLIEKPVGLLNINGFFDHLQAFINRAVEDRLIRKEHRDSIVVEQTPEKLLTGLKNTQSVTMEKWIRDIKSEKRV